SETMARKRKKGGNAGIGASMSRDAAPPPIANAAAAEPRTAPRRMLLIAAGMLVVIAIGVGAALVVHQRQTRFDMVRTLAEIARNEGAWDNPWDAQNRKIASLQDDIGKTTDPIKRLILRRELAQQYVNAGASEPAIATLEALLVEYKGMLPPRDV